MNTPQITLGMRLRIARDAAGISVNDMATTLGITRQTIGRYEHDQSTVPHAILYAYQDICQVPLEWLRGEVTLTQETVERKCVNQLVLWVPVRAA